MFNIFGLQEENPLDLSQLDHITDPEEYNRTVHDAIRNQLKSVGLVSPTDNVTNFQLQHEDTFSWLDSMMRTVTRNNPEVWDHPEDRDTYREKRFDFISGHEGWREKVYRDSRKLRTVGYGFNLEEPTNRPLFKQALGKTDKDFDDLRNGKTKLTKREGRILFEAAAGSAERLISSKFKDVDLKGYERLALVSLAYNSPALIGPNLTRHVKSGDKQAVMDEIIHRSNLRKSEGIANRRNLEAMMFSGMHEGEEDTGKSSMSVFGISSAQAAELPQNPQSPRPKNKPEPPKSKGSESKGALLSGLIPANIRALLSDITEYDLDTARNEDYLSDGELETLRRITTDKIKSSGKTSGWVEYKDYEAGQSDVSFAGSSGLVKTLLGDTEYIMKTTLGQYHYKIDERGHLIVTDQYNFNDAKKLQKENKSDEEKWKNLVTYAERGDVGYYGIIRRAGALWGSKEGEGAKFLIDLGPVSPQRYKTASR
tara:strand:+ start:327 stop:1772 length:1446 start_codon:yes stop_codon:yes gene_type:complete